MRAKAIEIRWHNTKSIYSTDFQRTPPSNLDELFPKKSHPYTKSEHEKLIEKYEKENGFGKVWRLATAGGDNMVMMWLVYPKPTMAQMAHHRAVHRLSTQSSSSASATSSTGPIEHQNAPVVEYLSTLAKHQGVVNVVRFCPKGEMLASADGNVLLWVLSTAVYDHIGLWTKLCGQVIRKGKLEDEIDATIYDVAWSPCGDFLLTGDTAKTARIWNVTDGLCIKQITEHLNFVQGVAWDPLGKFIATQSSDREENGGASAEVHHVGRNFKLDLFNSQINSWASYAGSQHSQKDDLPAESASVTPQTPTLVNNTPGTTPAPGSAASSLSAAKRTRPQLESGSIPTPFHSVTESVTTAHNINQVGSTNRIVSIPPTPSTTTSTQFNEEFMMLPPSEIPHHYHSTLPPQHLRTRSHSRQSSVVSSQTMSPSSLHPMRSPSPGTTVACNPHPRRPSAKHFTPAGRWDYQANSGDKRNRKGKEKEIDRRNIHSSGGKKKRKKKNIASTQLDIDSSDEEDATDKANGEPSHTVYIYGRGSIASSANNGFGDYTPVARLPGHKTSSLAIRFSPVFYELNPLSAKKMTDSSRKNPVRIELAKGKDIQQIDLTTLDVPSTERDLKSNSQDPSGEQAQARNNVEQRETVFDLPYRMSSPICLRMVRTLILSSSDGYCSLVAFDQNELGTPLSKEACSRITAYRDHTQEERDQELGSKISSQAESVKTDLITPSVTSRRTSVSNEAPSTLKLARPVPEDGPEGNPPKKKRVALTYEGPVRS
ncbi:chromatin assembly complex protein [Melampsora americana]|nr:chromatin assembly complex protein [Melampsora americana]